MFSDIARPRVLLVVFVLLVWMVAITTRLVYLQAYQHDWFRKRATLQQQSAFEFSPMRGLIVDRKGRELARSIDTESFFAVPDDIEDVDSTVNKLSAVVNINKEEIAKRLNEAKTRESKFQWIARKVDYETSEKIRALNLKGIHSDKEPKRYYPNNELAGDVLGFVNIDEVGISGLELAQNEKLQGEAGKVFVEKDAKRNVYESIFVNGRAGQTIVLTIDQMIQFYAQQAIAAAVQRTGAKSGTVVVLNPKTGEILALANAPTFNPNNPRDASSEAKDNNALKIYEPGSTFKIVTYSAAIEEGIARPEDTINCENGEYVIYSRRVKDSHRYGTLTLTQALAKSSNIAAIKLGQRLKEEKLYNYIKSFGFGVKTGVELPYEDSGLLRPVSRWSKTSIGSIPMGHEISVTPLQIASAFAVIANKGVRVTPHLIKETRMEDGTITFEAKPAEARVVKEETAKTIQQMLTNVVTSGTGKQARLASYTVAGKTGTAQKINEKTKAYSQSKYVASFVGFAPVSNPSVVIAVILDEPVGAHQGGAVASPVFRELAEKILPELNIAPDIDNKGTVATVADTETEDDFAEETGGGLGLEDSDKNIKRGTQEKRAHAVNKSEGAESSDKAKRKIVVEDKKTNKTIGKQGEKDKNSKRNSVNTPAARAPDSGKNKGKTRQNN